MRDLVRRVASFEIAYEAVAHCADVMIDAKNLLHYEHTALGRTLRIGAVGAERVLVGGGEGELLAQGSLPDYCTMRNAENGRFLAFGQGPLPAVRMNACMPRDRKSWRHH